MHSLTTERTLNRDMMINADPDGVARASMWLLDKVQGIEQPHTQVAAMAATFILMCNRFGVRHTDVFTCVNNLMHTKQGDRPEFRAIKKYLENEL